MDFGGMLGPIGSIAGSVLGYMGQQDTNDTAYSIYQGSQNFNQAEAERTRQFNSQQAELNRQFQAAQTSTAYQRATADMQAAGLNPMLAYSQGGASSASGGAASGPAASSPPPPAINNALAAGINSGAAVAHAMQANANTELLSAKKEEALASATRNIASAGQLDAQRDQIRQEMQSFEKRMERLGWDTDQAESQAFIMRNEQFRSSTERNYVMQNLQHEAQILRDRAILVGAEIPEAVSRAAFWRSPVGTAAPYTEHFSGTIGSITGSAANVRRAIGDRGTGITPGPRNIYNIWQRAQ